MVAKQQAAQSFQPKQGLQVIKVIVIINALGFYLGKLILIKCDLYL